MSRIDSAAWMFRATLLFVFVPALFSIVISVLGEFGPVMRSRCTMPIYFLFPGWVLRDRF